MLPSAYVRARGEIENAIEIGNAIEIEQQNAARSPAVQFSIEGEQNGSRKSWPQAKHFELFGSQIVGNPLKSRMSVRYTTEIKIPPPLSSKSGYSCQDFYFFQKSEIESGMEFLFFPRFARFWANLGSKKSPFFSVFPLHNGI